MEDSSAVAEFVKRHNELEDKYDTKVMPELNGGKVAPVVDDDVPGAASAVAELAVWPENWTNGCQPHIVAELYDKRMDSPLIKDEGVGTEKLSTLPELVNQVVGPGV